MEEVELFPRPESSANRFVYCFLLQFSVYLLLYMVGYNAEQHIVILGSVRKFKFKEYNQKNEELQKKLNRLDMKEKLLR